MRIHTCADCGVTIRNCDYCAEVHTCEDCRAKCEGEACQGCGTPGSNYEGLCYACQCDAHAEGRLDMDRED